MFEYCKVVMIIFDFLGNDFVTQLLLLALVLMPAYTKRKLFAVRFILCWLAIIGLHLLYKFRIVPDLCPLNYIITMAMLFATYKICYVTDVWQAMFASVCLYCVQYITSNVTRIVSSSAVAATGNFENYMYHFVAMPIVVAISMVLTYFFITRRLKSMENIQFNSHIVIYIAVAFTLVSTVIAYYSWCSVWFMPHAQVWVLVLSTLFSVSTLLAGFLNIRSRQLEVDNAVLQQMLKKDKQRYEQAKLNSEKIQIKYHDMLRYEHSGVVDYGTLSECECDKEIVNSTFYTGCPALDVVLFEKALLCERKNIKFVCTADGTAIDFLKPHHIYSLVGNALENAINSLCAEDDGVYKSIELSVTRRENMCIFKTDNYISHEVTIVDGMPQTSNRDKENHGFGTKSMRNVVERYGGQIRFFQKDNIFTVLAMLPIPPNDNVQ